MIEDFSVPAVVSTVHILSTGEMIWSREEYEKVKDRFTWVDRHYILSEVLRLRTLTDNGRKTIIAIYETGRQIRKFMNIDHNFHISDLETGE